MEGHYSTATAAELTGASVRMLDYWARTGLLRPSGRDAAGKGTKRRYTFRDLVALIAIYRLRTQKCPLQKIRKAVRYLKAHYPDDSDSRMLARLTLLTDGDDVYLLTDQKAVMNVVTRQQVWAVPLGMLIKDVRKRVAEMPVEWAEPVRVKGKLYHLLLTRDDEYGGYLAQCRELPGALEQGETAAEAVANGKDAIASVLTFLAKRRRSKRGSKRAKAG